MTLTLCSFAVSRKAYEHITKAFSEEYEGPHRPAHQVPTQLWRLWHAGKASARMTVHEFGGKVRKEGAVVVVHQGLWCPEWPVLASPWSIGPAMAAWTRRQGLQPQGLL